MTDDPQQFADNDAPLRARFLLVLDGAVERQTLTYDEAIAVLDAFDDASAIPPGEGNADE
jgi:hypothetical protein